MRLFHDDSDGPGAVFFFSLTIRLIFSIEKSGLVVVLGETEGIFLRKESSEVGGTLLLKVFLQLSVTPWTSFSLNNSLTLLFSIVEMKSTFFLGGGRKSA